MKDPVKTYKIHQKAYHHIRKHKKHYVRIALFFIFLVIYSVIEDIIAMSIHGMEFDLVVLVNVFIIAMVFTGIAELTERLYKKEEPEIKEYGKKMKSAIKKEEDFLESEEKNFEKRIRKR
ncbi:MAG: hypothetical protein V1678_05320 [Candidatus Aenigmatarchaeota archaeon]